MTPLLYALGYAGAGLLAMVAFRYLYGRGVVARGWHDVDATAYQTAMVFVWPVVILISGIVLLSTGAMSLGYKHRKRAEARSKIEAEQRKTTDGPFRSSPCPTCGKS